MFRLFNLSFIFGLLLAGCFGEEKNPPDSLAVEQCNEQTGECCSNQQFKYPVWVLKSNYPAGCAGFNTPSSNNFKKLDAKFCGAGRIYPSGTCPNAPATFKCNTDLAKCCAQDKSGKGAEWLPLWYKDACFELGAFEEVDIAYCADVNVANEKAC